MRHSHGPSLAFVTSLGPPMDGIDLQGGAARLQNESKGREELVEAVSAHLDFRVAAHALATQFRHKWLHDV